MYSRKPTKITRSHSDSEKYYIGGRHQLLEAKTFDQFLKSKVVKQDCDLLEDLNIATKLVELGIRGMEKSGYSKRTFERLRQQVYEEYTNAGKRSSLRVISKGMDFSNDPVLRCMQQREEANRVKRITTIIMVRDLSRNGNYEVSGYIDYAHRLEGDSFEKIFRGKEKLRPMKGDLSIMNYLSYEASTKDSPNYEVLTQQSCGMLFRSKLDKKILNPNADEKLPGNVVGITIRTEIPCKDYLQVVFYDQVIQSRGSN